MIIVDTNVLSEAMRERPELRVAAWLDQQPEAEMFTTRDHEGGNSIWDCDIAPGKKRAARETAAEYIFSGPFSGRILRLKTTRRFTMPNLGRA